VCEREGERVCEKERVCVRVRLIEINQPTHLVMIFLGTS